MAQNNNDVSRWRTFESGKPTNPQILSLDFPRLEHAQAAHLTHRTPND